MLTIQKYTICVILVIIAFTTFSVKADYETGFIAYKNKNYSKAYKEWMPLAQLGDAKAQVSIGKLYFSGEGVKKNIHQAIIWYDLAAKQNYSAGQYLLGNIYAKGVGVPIDANQAYDLYQSAAKQGHAEAQFHLGVILFKGETVKQDYVKAAQMYKNAAEQGLMVAQTNLAGMYALGLGLDRDLVLAYSWYTLAIKQGSDRAQENREFMADRMTEKQISRAMILVHNWTNNK